MFYMALHKNLSSRRSACSKTVLSRSYFAVLLDRRCTLDSETIAYNQDLEPGLKPGFDVTKCFPYRISSATAQAGRVPGGLSAKGGQVEMQW